MKQKRYFAEQIVAAMKQQELGTPAAEIIRTPGIAEQVSCRWKRRHAGLEPCQVRELNQLHEENGRLKELSVTPIPSMVTAFRQRTFV